MSTIKERRDELQSHETVRLITRALRDISALNLHSIRKEVEKGQSYFKEIENLYKLIKIYAEKRKVTLRSKEGETYGTLFVAVTSNKRLYGSLNKKVMGAFQGQMDRDPAGAFLIIGETGKEFFKGTPYEKRCMFFEFKSDDPTPYETIVFVDTTRRYENVFMFYPKFINVFKQDTTLRDIAYIPSTPQKETATSVDYIFEPELGEIFWFFETQVRYILFNQVLLEIKLARVASRLLRMNMAEQSVTEVIQRQRIRLGKAYSSLVNIRLLEVFSGIHKWKKNL